MPQHPTIEDIRAAAARIDGIARPTRVIGADWLGPGVSLKLECEQQTGSFKVRGAANALHQLSAEERDRGVVAVSSGNHGRAVAFVAGQLGVDATICISSRVPPVKVDAMQELGATVVVAGADQDAADAEARRLVADEGRVFIHPFDDPRVIAGQGTIGLEILEQVPDVDTIVVPLSGGGLAGGVALAVKSLQPGISLVGVSQDRGPAMVESIRAGRLVDVIEDDTLADALAGGLGDTNHHSFDLCRTLIDELVLVTEDDIAGAMASLWERTGVVAEGGGAVGVAALASGRATPGRSTVVIVSGGNVDRAVLDGILGGTPPT